MYIKKSFAMFMAIILLISTLSGSFSVFADDKAYPYVDENGTYWRISDGEPKAFNTDYDEMVSYFQQQLVNRANKISYSFATTDSSYAYSYINGNDAASAQAVANELFKDLYVDIFTTNTENPQLGDYLYNSVSISSYGTNFFISSADNPVDNNPRYYTFTITMGDISYISTADEEEKIADFAKNFSDIFLENCDTDYKKVKTIYDFVVRNSTYDYDVFTGKYSIDSKRYFIAHSAYGALYGSLINDGKLIGDYDSSFKESVTGQKIINTADQGLAVCEGYSKLFYYLCTYNGIKCRIVDGDYTAQSSKKSDPHEWNYVYLDDGCGDGYKWFQIDSTFASQKSYKQIDLNCYDYFLCGTSNINFGYNNHQQPYTIDNADVKQQLYDWYNEKNASSYEDYRIPLADLDSTLYSDNNTVIIKRSTVYNENDDEKTAFIITDMQDTYRIEIDESGVYTFDNVDGFSYNGTDAKFTIVVPYMIDREYSVEDIGPQKECGSYNIGITGADGTSYKTQFSIVPLNMSNNKEGNYTEIDVQTSAGYTGEAMTPHTFVIDKYNHKLEEGVDFDVYVFSDDKHTTLTEIKDIGTYYLDVAYKGNYSGHYYLTFNVDKIKLSQINSDNQNFDYLPKYFREYNGVTDATSYFIKAGANLKIGDITINPGVDFSLKANGGLEYGDKGTITLTGTEGSKKVEAGTTLSLTYEISGKFDIAQNFDGGVADSNTTNVHLYTGSAIKPTSFDYLDQRLVQGKDYKIVSYSNNVNSGKAKVIIEGINGCTGRAELAFMINPASIGSAKLTTSKSGSNVTCSLTYNGKSLVKGVDYTETKTSTSTGYKITITGKGNFSGSRVVNVSVSKTDSYIKPTASGNYVTLSSSSYTYDGKVKKPTVKVYNKSKKLIHSYYYTVSYASGRKNVGKYKITIKFRNGYSGTLTKTFTIKPKNTSISKVTAGKKKFTVKWKKYTTQTTGYQIQYSTSSKFSNAKTVTVSKNKTTSKTISKLKAKKKYYVRIRTYKTVSGTKYYSSWSKAKTVTTKK
ncbi:MAG: transglutaminase domain-containing protein [Eubacterium sp.]